ncbi:MAG: hypothetical protein A2Z24_00875 [Candidatus Woykebacteria bacterium RBG_16_44_10]|uniref:Uncharacterized protein n=1 Tax=Candidatus Woykebacteria bacterium RBG_16_44_10 TaxID=1802597 RepID=A0A1G1WEP3_9BACT|nr:MAG: hypothetical protein A2Z24_00875 [Candidatus Woykebacteria bacterium RBG_16_44_10]
MKKIKTENQKAAKKFFRDSFTNNKLDVRKVRKHIQAAKNIYKSSTLGIIKSYLALIKRHLQNNTVVIETAEKLDQKKVATIQTHFAKKLDKKLEARIVQNPNIFAGLRITLGDNQWDYSAKGKLNQIREFLHGKYSS